MLCLHCSLRCHPVRFYPYRYFASEGFLPGYNFPRLPVRAFIRSGEDGDFISRPRHVALREFAPSNIIYYEGSKFEIHRSRIPAGGVQYERLGVCFSCGYFHSGDDYQRQTCENCGATLQDANGNASQLKNVLEMHTMLTRRRQRITCDEEDRMKYGYNITTHFRYASNRKQSAQIIMQNGTPILNLSYGDTAQIWRINRGSKRNQERGFKLDTRSGTWGEPQGVIPPTLDTEVNLLVKETSNILVIEPQDIPSNQTEAFLATLQYALERAIQKVYKLEDNELGSERLGQGKTLLFWEAAEGGAGVLTQLLEDPNAFQRIAQTALEICHFIETKESCTQACYECLLSYRNQSDHAIIDRHLIKNWLQDLCLGELQKTQQDTERDAHYQTLLQQIDPNSRLERLVLDDLYDRGIPLPDTSQELISEADIKPDSLYKNAKIAIFCDGSVHDSLDQQERDLIARDNLKYKTGYQVITLNYREDWKSKLTILHEMGR